MDSGTSITRTSDDYRCRYPNKQRKGDVSIRGPIVWGVLR